MRTHLLGALLLASTFLHAQVDVDRPVVLTGPGGERRVVGLADAADAGDAANARGVRTGGYTYADIAGGNAWNVQLSPASPTTVAGTRLRLRVAIGNTGPVQVTLDGSGPYALLKSGGAPLDSGDVRAGQVAVLVHDGSAFRLVRTERRERRACPSGFVAVNELYCIQTVENDTSDWTTAATICGDMNARLCTWMEWYRACANAGQLGLTDMVGNWEWTNNTANGDGLVRVVGESTCTQAATSAGWNAPARASHCCYRR